jgi:hypothetical protein
MRRVLWPFGLVVAFGLGLAAGIVPRHWPSVAPSREVEQSRAAEGRLQAQVSTLQARLRATEARLADQQSPRMGYAAASKGTGQGLDGRQRYRAQPGVEPDEQGRQGRLARGGAAPRGGVQDGVASAGDVARAAVPAPSVDAALERLYRYLGETSQPGGASRWQRAREVADDLRAMGDAGAEAILRALAGGTSSEERRAAAQLAGDLQIAQALPLLQDILDRDADVLLRRAAALGIRRLETPDTIPVMQALLANPAEDRFVRMSAALGLAQLGNPLGVTGLAQIFEESTVDGRGREMAFRALSSLNDERSLPFMRQLLTSGVEVSYRLQAINFLTAQGDRQALVPLQLLMQSPTEQPSIREAAARAYATIARR